MRMRKDETPDEAIGRLMAEAAKKAAPKVREAYELAVAENGHTGSVLDLVEDVLQPALAEHFGEEYTQRRKPFAA
ncbi:hypothetical protein [Sediminicurvatus halobius]|uniref:Uncharacterized protein n=1 Tax=Sediminicurvatus halobius TaxID=2182432 RepID=A0A2U2MZV1_9GAMM|nr:hypothetical protein [Spiribacter halobius]PWG62327.1 hypothetical protein DEM34_12700 [Spiribacter halobius]UEX79751.1 hypothetical protein LMH63_08925 [Spiribacter halobius]